MLFKKEKKKILSQARVAESCFKGSLLDAVRVESLKSVDTTQYPFSLDIIKSLKEIHFPTQVTFFIGENGAGKSTLLEAIAYHAGFGTEGGSKNISFKTSVDNVYSGVQKLADHLILSWRQNPKMVIFSEQRPFIML